jgi:hypothetical protein
MKPIIKNADTHENELVSSIKDYFASNIGNNTGTGILDLLAPGAVLIAFKALNLGWVGFLISMAMKIFHINISEILSSVFNKIKTPISNKQPLSSNQIDNMVASSIQEHVSPGSEQEEKEFFDSKSFNQNLRSLQLLKMSSNNGLIINAGLFSNKKTVATSLLTDLISWFFKIGIASAGLMVAGDVANKVLDRPNALDKTYDRRKINPSSDSEPLVTPTQTKFKLNPGFSNQKAPSPWVEDIPNNESSIQNMIINFAKEVYSGLNGKEAQILSSPRFNLIKDKIVFYNESSKGDNMVFIPKFVTSKKELVDLFIDDVAKSA